MSILEDRLILLHMPPTSTSRDSQPPFSFRSIQADVLPILTVGALTLAVSFFTTGVAFDSHWTTSWVLLAAIGVLLSATSSIGLTHPKWWVAGMIVLTAQAVRGGQAQWEVLGMWAWLWTWVFSVPDKSSWLWRGVKALPMFAVVVGSIMMVHALKGMASGDWSHGQTYVMTLPWAHRNIGMEALFAMAVLGGQISRQRWWRWWVFITALALVYQVRGVLLASALWLGYEVWMSGMVSAKVRRVVALGAAAFIVAQVAWNLVPSESRVRAFKKVPDMVKSLDVVYNLHAAESSSTRLKLWGWTLKNSSFMGEGLASWREDAEGHVNVATDRCHEAVRRAHSELLQWTYELGWIPLLLLLALCWPWRQALGRWAWFALPFLAFTFPMERAEILWPFAVLGWWFKPDASESQELTLSRRWPLVAFASITLSLLAWNISQNALARIFLQRGKFHVNWSPLEEACVNAFPLDIAMNPADMLRSMSAFNDGKDDLGMSLIEDHLESHPRSLPAIRVWLKANGRPHKPEAVCDYLSNLPQQ